MRRKEPLDPGERSTDGVLRLRRYGKRVLAMQGVTTTVYINNLHLER